jgi:hypothetical protein
VPVRLPQRATSSDRLRCWAQLALNDGDASGSVDDFDGAAKAASWWGYVWPSYRVFNQVELTTGVPEVDGGWFITKPVAEYRRDGEWHRIPVQTISPAFELGRAAGKHATYTIEFDPVTADGVRIIAAPGGDHSYSSLAELEVSWAAQE